MSKFYSGADQRFIVNAVVKVKDDFWFTFFVMI